VSEAEVKTPQRLARVGRYALTVVAVLVLAAALRWKVDGDGIHPIDTLTRFLIAIAVILMFCHLLGAAVARIGQPRVIGEILGGLLLGPSGLGWVWPDGQAWLFPRPVLDGLSLAAQLGLIVFVFLLGCELRTEGDRGPRQAATLMGFAMALPFLAGIGLAYAGRSLLSGPVRPEVYVVFVGLALSITALPVLARVLIDLRLQHTPVGSLSLAAAVFGDGLAWALLTVILAATAGSTGQVVGTVALAVGLLAVTQLVVRPALARYSRRQERDGAGATMIPILVATAIAFAAVTQLGGLHPIIGAFLFGTAVPRESAVVRQLDEHLRGFAVTILLPVFFVGIGLTTSIGLIGNQLSHWLVFLALLVVATGTKLIGGALGARFAGLRGSDVGVAGALMNCRGVTELVIASVGYQAHLISDFGFACLVLMALVTTATTGPLVRLFQRRGHEEEPPAPAVDPPAVAIVVRAGSEVTS
jgi:Kef-type K+ transport system membrane component KefB